MATTASRITDDAGWSPFYYLKITGLPYYWFATVDPTSSTYGSDAWTLSSGYTAIRGMELPDDTMTQSISDFVGGIASPERIRLRLLDIDAWDSSGRYSLLGRLWAMGRPLNDTSIGYGLLDADVTTGATSITARGSGSTSAPFTTGAGTIYVGAETMTHSSSSFSSATSTTTFTIDARNKFPCHTAYPPTPFYRTWHDSEGNPQPSSSVTVTTAPSPMVGRSAAFYIGHMKPGTGTPETEANALCRMVGRITSFQFQDGAFELEIESIANDLKNAKIAPQLARSSIAAGQYVIQSPYNTFLLAIGAHDQHDGAKAEAEWVITIPSGTYTNSPSVATAVNTAIAALSAKHVGGRQTRPSVRLQAERINGEWRWVFRRTSAKGDNVNGVFWVQHGHTAIGYSSLDPNVLATLQTFGPDTSLLTALGFPPSRSPFVAVDPESAGLSSSSGIKQIVVSPDIMPGVFLPTIGPGLSYSITLSGPDKAGTRFFTDQGDGSARAWARFGNGSVMRVTATGTQTLTLGNRFLEGGYLLQDYNADDRPTVPEAYIVPLGQEAYIEQVVISPEPAINPSYPLLTILAQFLCSNSAGQTVDALNCYPEGVGLGWRGIFDTTSLHQANAPKDYARRIIVDKETTFSEVFTPIAKENGIWLVWDASAGGFAFRVLSIPCSANAETFAFNESNRARASDTSDATIDNSIMRSGFTLKYGWDRAQGKFTSNPISYVDYYAINVYGLANKTETVEDKTLSWNNSVANSVISDLVRRARFWRYPWVRVRRTVNKTGLTLSPGTFHQVIDNTIHNPFTGARGITSSDAVYAILTSVRTNLATGAVEVEFYICSEYRSIRFSGISPTGLVNFGASNNGYSSGTLTLTLDSFYADSGYDGADFAAGDKVRLTTRDNDGAVSYSYQATISTVSADGSTIVFTSALAGAISTTGHSILVLDTYTNQIAARQYAGASAVAFVGSASSGLVAATARTSKWT